MLELIINGFRAGVFCELLCGMYGEYQLNWPLIVLCGGSEWLKIRSVVRTAFRQASGVVKRGPPPPPFQLSGMASGLKWEILSHICVWRLSYIVKCFINRTCIVSWVLVTEII
jgi:hypothetical protein